VQPIGDLLDVGAGGGQLGHALQPVSAAYGAMLVMLCDGVARAALPPAEIPLGLITALVGGPFFLFVLARRARRRVPCSLATCAWRTSREPSWMASAASARPANWSD